MPAASTYTKIIVGRLRRHWAVFPLVALGVWAVVIVFSASVPSAEDKQRAQATAQLNTLASEWGVRSDAILAEIEAFERRGLYGDSFDLINKYSRVAQKQLEPVRARVKAAKLRDDIRLKRGEPIAIEGLYGELLTLTPNDPAVKREYADAKRNAKAYRAKVAAAEKAGAAAELRFRRSQGVSIGMSKTDVLLSSWGRPESINTTTTPAGDSEQWVYGSRHYLYFSNGVLTSIQTSK